MKTYIIGVKVWDVALVEVEAENEDKAQDIALDFDDDHANWVDGGREVLSVEEIEDEEDEEDF